MAYVEDPNGDHTLWECGGCGTLYPTEEIADLCESIGCDVDDPGFEYFCDGDGWHVGTPDGDEPDELPELDEQPEWCLDVSLDYTCTGCELQYSGYDPLEEGFNCGSCGGLLLAG